MTSYGNQKQPNFTKYDPQTHSCKQEQETQLHSHYSL